MDVYNTISSFGLSVYKRTHGFGKPLAGKSVSNRESIVEVHKSLEVRRNLTQIIGSKYPFRISIYIGDVLEVYSPTTLGERNKWTSPCLLLQ